MPHATATSAATPQPSHRRALCRRRSRYVSSHPLWLGGRLQRRLPKHIAPDGAGSGTFARDGTAIFHLLVNDFLGSFNSVLVYLISPECTPEKSRCMQAALGVQAVAKSHLACTLRHAAGVQRNPTSRGVLGGAVVGPTAPPAPGRHPPPLGGPPAPPVIRSGWDKTATHGGPPPLLCFSVFVCDALPHPPPRAGPPGPFTS